MHNLVALLEDLPARHTLVAINDRDVTSPFNVQIPSSGRYTLKAYRTSPTEDLAQIFSARWNIRHQTLVSTLSPRSVTTFQLTAK